MKVFSVLVGLFFSVSVLAGEAEDWVGYEKLPLVQHRTLKGQWNLGGSCTGALISGDGKNYWAQVCIINTGCCNGTHGDVIVAVRPNVYVDRRRNTTYTIQKDGSMRIERPDIGTSVYSAHLELDNPSWEDLASWQRE
jgi:hypothetical protein